MKRNFSLLILIILIIFSCTKKNSRESNQQLDYNPVDSQILSFWDSIDLSKIDLSNPDEQTERTFIEYIQHLLLADENIAQISVNNLLKSAQEKDSTSFQYFTKSFEKYLYNPNSPIRNEAVYSHVLNYIVHNSGMSEIEKTRYNYQLSMISKNNVGETATDFEFTSKGKKMKISEIQSDYIILFFNDPECHDCVRVKSILAQIKNPNVKIVSIFTEKKLVVWQNTVYPESWLNGYNNTDIHELYDLKAMPTLYLLDKNKTVVLKDADVESIFEMF